MTTHETYETARKIWDGLRHLTEYCEVSFESLMSRPRYEGVRLTLLQLAASLAAEPDTSDIPETKKEWFETARLAGAPAQRLDAKKAERLLELATELESCGSYPFPTDNSIRFVAGFPIQEADQKLIAAALRSAAHHAEGQPFGWVVDHRHKPTNDGCLPGGGSKIFRSEDKADCDAFVAQLRSLNYVENVTVTTLYAGGRSPAEKAPARQPIATAPRDGTRLVLIWDEYEDMPMHFEVGWFKDGGWLNTYGRPFGGTPTHWLRPDRHSPAEKAEPIAGPNMQVGEFDDNSGDDAAWHKVQDALDEWAQENLDGEAACGIMSWSDRIAQFVASRLSQPVTDKKA